MTRFTGPLRLARQSGSKPVDIQLFPTMTLVAGPNKNPPVLAGVSHLMRNAYSAGLLIATLGCVLPTGIAQNVMGTQAQGDLSYRRILEDADVPVSRPAVSPDGKRLAFVRGGNLFVRDLATGVVGGITAFEGSDGASDVPVWSPDSARLSVATTNRTSLVVLNADGSAAHSVYRAPTGTLVFPRGWSADGTMLLVWVQAPPNQRLAWISIVDSTLQPIPTSATPDLNAAVSPDGRYVAFFGRLESTSASVLYVVTSDGLEQRGASDALPNGQLCGWMPDGKHILVLRSATLWSVPITDGRIAGPPLMLDRNLGTALHGVPSVTPIGITSGGTFYYRRTIPTSDIYTASLDPITGKVASEPIPLPLSRAGDNVLPRWSPDGHKILFHWIHWAPADNIAYTVDTGREERLAPNIASAAICWADDGTSILAIPFVGGQSPYQGLVRVNLQTGTSTVLAAPSPNMVPLNCAGDLVTLATQDALRVYNIASGSETLLYRYTVRTNTRPSLSHDAKSVAVVTTVGPGVTALLLVPASGGEPRELVRLNQPAEFQQQFFGYAWSPDDRFVYYLKRPNPQAPFELFRIAATGGPEQDVGLNFPELRDIDISPDGTEIAFSVGDPIRAEIWAVDNVLTAAPR